MENRKVIVAITERMVKEGKGQVNVPRETL